MFVIYCALSSFDITLALSTLSSDYVVGVATSRVLFLSLKLATVLSEPQKYVGYYVSENIFRGYPFKIIHLIFFIGKYILRFKIKKAGKLPVLGL